MWLAAVMAKCHKAILAYHGAHRNHSDLSALGKAYKRCFIFVLTGME